MDFAKTLTKWANEPTVADLKQDYIDSSSDRSTHVTKVNTWLDNLQVKGSAVVKSKAGSSTLVPKLIRKQAEWRYASLSEPFLSTDDVFNVSPITYEDSQAAVQNQLIINNQFNTKLDKVKFIDEYVRTAVDEGTVIVRVGWEFREEEQEVEVESWDFQPTNDPAAIQQLQEAIQVSQNDPEGFAQQVPPEMQQAVQMTMQSGSPVMPVKVVNTETQMVTVANHPTATVCHYKNVTLDPTCMGDVSKANFAIFSFDTSLSELERDGKYKNLDYINSTAESAATTADDVSLNGGSSFIFSDKARQKITAYEYWGFRDIHNDGTLYPIVATYVGDVMIRMELNPFPDKQLPFIVVQYLPVRHSIYGEPDGELLLENQKIIGAVTRGMIDVMGRSANGQMGTRKDALDVTNKRKFVNGGDYEFNSQVDPRQAFYMHTYPEIPQSASLMLQLQNNDAESLTGIKAFTNGITGQALGSTATAVRSALDATSKRELGILRRLAEGIKQIARKFISMNAIFLSEEEVVRITNEEFVAIRRDDLAGKFDLTLTISTAEADNQKAEELSFMLQTMGNNVDSEFSRIILAEIAKLRKMPDLAKKIISYQPQPDPVQQEMQMMQLEMLKAQVQVESAKAMEAQANAQLAQAKAQKEMAMAQNLSSDTDLKNLDYVEQESGTKQERDLQKMGAQAKGNIALKVTDNAMKQQAEEAKQRRELAATGTGSL